MNTSSKLDDSLLRDIAKDLLSQRQDTLLRRKEREELRKQIIKPLLDVGYAIASEAQDELADRAIDLALEEQYRFNAPDPGALATAYVRRRHLGRKYGIPAAMAAILGFTVWGGSALYKEHELNTQERNVEAMLENDGRELVTLRNKLSTMQRDGTIAKMLPHTQALFSEHIQGASRFGDDAESVLAQYVRNGNARESVTRENFMSIRPKAELASTHLASAQRNAQVAQGILQREHHIIEVRATIDRTVAEIRSMADTPAPLSRLAETHYTHGLASIEQRNLEEAKENVSHLQELRKDIDTCQQTRATMAQYLQGILASRFASPAIKERASAFHTRGLSGIEQYNMAEARSASENLDALHARVAKLDELAPVATRSYESAVRVSRDWRAQQELQRHYASAQEAINTAETGKLEQSMMMLQDLDNKLHATRLIIQRGRERDRISRYLILRAEDPDGNVLRFRVRNRETDSYEFVADWGKLVDPQTFKLVADDYNDTHGGSDPDHVIDDNVYATKQQGYLDWSIHQKFRDSKSGLSRSECSDCITRW